MLDSPSLDSPPPFPLPLSLPFLCTAIPTPTSTYPTLAVTSPTLAVTSPTLAVTTPTLTTTTPTSTITNTQTSKVETEWKNTLTTPTINAFIPPSPIGPTVAIPDTPLEIFRLFYTPQLIQEIVNQTNLYAKEVMGAVKFSQWTPVAIEDMEAFLGFNLLMGLNPKSSIEDYWKKNPNYHYPPIADRISRDRYREISRFLHFADNSTLSSPGSPGYDRIGKIRPLLEYLQGRFKSVYNPGREIAVDEAMIKFQGRSSLKQYMPKKPIKRWIKVWVLGDSCNGYFSRLDVYTGRKGNTTEVGLGARVVKELTQDFHNRWHRVYFDNFLTSKTLLCDLEKVGLYGCGTARSDRKFFPAELKKPKLEKR